MSTTTRPHKGTISGSIHKGESAVQARVVLYLQNRWPGIPFYGNATANIFQGGNMGPRRQRETVEQFKARQAMAGGAMNKMSKSLDLGAHKGWPDLQVCSPSNLFGDAQVLHGLFVELKDNGCSPFRVDGKGLLVNERSILQAQTLAGLCKQGYLGAFAVGEDQAKLLIDAYLGDTNARKAIKIQREIVPGGWIYRLK